MVRTVWLLFALVLLLAAAALALIGYGHRSEGRQNLAAVLERHEAAGYGASFADLAARAPLLDRERQSRLWTWMKGNVPASAVHVDRDAAWRLELGTPPPSKALEAHEAFREDIERLEALFAEGNLCLTSLGWLPENPEKASFSERMGGHIPNLLRLRAAYNWYAVETARADDPARALSMLRRLHEGLARPGCLIDSMIAVACDAMRDDAMLVLALSGRCPEAALQAWLEEPPRAARLVADGLRGERLRFGAPLAQDLAAGGSVAGHFGETNDSETWPDTWDDHIRGWARGAADCATYLEGMVALERYVLGEIEREELDARLAATEELGSPFSLMLPNGAGIVSASAAADRHRLIRAAVVLAQQGQAGTPLPAAEPEALARLKALRPALHSDEGRTPLRYLRLAEDRFRVAMDLHDDGDPLRQKEQASSEPLVLRHGFVEIQIP